MKKFSCLLFVICLLSVFAKAQACGYGQGRISVFNGKDQPLNKFKITFYDVDGFDFSNKPKVIRAEFIGNGWDIYLDKKEAESFIKKRKPFTNEWFSDPKIVYYKDNTFNYRTLENGGALVITKITAKSYHNFYFISPVFSGCFYGNKIILKKK